jgi:hypothetical protein
MEGTLLMAVALLLGAAGAAKLRTPAPTVAMAHRLWRAVPDNARAVCAVRIIGSAEMAAAIATLATGGRLAAIALATWFFAFAAVTALLVRRAPATPCGCFGSADSPAGPAHIALNLAGAAIATAAAVRPPGAFGGVFDRTALAGLVGTAQVLLLAYLGFLSITALPALAAQRRRVEAR